ncbi:MAG: hypothetical protein QHJ73_08820, partial [Armatimonadota bacterium]|nr:hypothetical protein [Armatimonadota bacterium]
QLRWAARAQSYAIHTPRGTLRTESAAFRDYVEAVLAHLQRNTRPGDPVFCFPWSSFFYFLSGRTNPTSFQVLLPGQYTRQQFRQAITELQRRPPRAVVWEHFPEARFSPGMDLEGYRELGTYLQQHYRVVAELHCPPPGFVAKTTLMAP